MKRRREGFKDRLGASGPGLTIAVIALVLALTGGAFAAAGKLTGSEKKEVKKIAKKFAGKNGKNGNDGAPGAAGPVGAQGNAGANGTNGTNGADGVSANATAFVGNQHGCEEGGIEVKSAQPTVYVCNGKKGTNGTSGTNGVSAKATSFIGSQGSCTEGGVKVESAEAPVFVCNGSPWTAGGKLPPGAVETGSWTFNGTEADTSGIRVALPFAIPLEGPLEGHVHYQFEPGFSTICKGGAEFPNPTAGELCVYVNPADEPTETTFEKIDSASFEEEGASPQGAVLKFSAPTGVATGGGTFAVRAP